MLRVNVGDEELGGISKAKLAGKKLIRRGPVIWFIRQGWALLSPFRKREQSAIPVNDQV